MTEFRAFTTGLCALEGKDFEKFMDQINTVVPGVEKNIAEDWLIESSKVIVQDIEDGNIGIKGNPYDTLLSQLNWHIRRKNKFGASDMSALYMEFKGNWYPFGDAASIIADKLCMKPVGSMNGDTSRGVFMEEHCRESFIRMMAKQGIQLTVDEYTMKKISNLRFSGGIPDMRWMDCSPDDIFLDQDGRRYLIDYKCPAESSSVEVMQRDVPEYYQAQLAQEKIILEYLELPADHIYLVPFSTKEWKAFPVECEISDEMCMDVINAGNYYHEFIDRKELPRRPPSKDYQFVHQLPDEVQDAILEFTLHKKGELMHGDEAERLKSRLVELLTINNVDLEDVEKKTGLPLIDHRWQTTRRKNVQAMENELIALGVDVSDDKFFTESKSRIVTVNRGKHNSYAEIRDGIEDFMAGQIANSRAEVVDQFKEAFRNRDGVVVTPPKASKKKVVAPSDKATTPEPF